MKCENMAAVALRLAKVFQITLAGNAPVIFASPPSKSLKNILACSFSLSAVQELAAICSWLSSLA